MSNHNGIFKAGHALNYGMTDAWEEHETVTFDAVAAWPQVQAILKILAEDCRYDQHASEEAKRVLVACYSAFLSDPEHGDDLLHPNTIKLYLSDLKNGYGCWMDEIKAAIDKAQIPDEERAFIHGAFYMAQQFIYALHREKCGYA